MVRGYVSVLWIVSVCMNLICSFFLYRLSGLLVEYRTKLRFLFLVWCMFLLPLPIYDTDATNVLGMLAAFLFIVLICTKGELINRLSVVLIFYPLILGLNYLLCNNPVYSFKINFMMFLQQNSNDLAAVDYLLNFAAGLFLDLLKVLVWALLYYGFKKRLEEIKRYMSGRIWLIISVICTISFLSMVTVIVFPPFDAKTAAEYYDSPGLFYGSYRTFVIVISGILSIIGILYLLQPVIENVKNREKLQIEGLKEEYYRSLEEQQESVRRLRHDMNNHFQTIKSCLEQGDISGAGEYLEQFGSSLPAGTGKQFCSDRALNAVLNHRWEKLQNLQADVHFNLEIKQVMEVTSLELCTIFSNALDNAIEAVSKIPDPVQRKVFLQARTKKGYFSLRIANSKENRIISAHGKMESDKKEAGHGYGLENIRESAKRYEGNMEVEYTEKEFVLFLYLRLE